MKFKVNTKLLLWVGIWLLLSSVELPAARIAGEEGVTSVGPKPKKPAEKPAPVKPAVEKKPPPVRKKVVPKRKIIQRKKVLENRDQINAMSPSILTMWISSSLSNSSAN